MLHSNLQGGRGCLKSQSGWLGLVVPVCSVCDSRALATALSCRPRDGSAVLLCLHPQGCDAGGLAVGLTVQLIPIDARADASATKEAAHVSLSHVAART